MPSDKAVALGLLMPGRLKTQQLIEYTNDSNSATTIDYDRLNFACEDALGAFRGLAKAEPDLDNTMHVVCLFKGIMYMLALYGGRDSNIIDKYNKDFYVSCTSIAKLLYPLAISNSPLVQSTQGQGTLPDMDRSRTIFSNGRSYGGAYPQETRNYS